MVVGVWSLVGSGASFDRPIGTREQVGTTFCHVQVMFSVMNCEKQNMKSCGVCQCRGCLQWKRNWGMGDDGINHPSEGVGRAL